ncbi:MAG: serine/threonine protein kinase [Planctomycetaceae bacterium]|nr:serine/threonine protein kinase [Planctomycetaceae bacterium]
MEKRDIDSLCDEFEAALRQEDTIRIEDFLPQVENEKRSELLNELLEIEIQFAAERNMSEDSLRQMKESLEDRFPNKLALIQSLFRHAQRLRHIGDYEILDELGRGGMGIVYKAKHKLLQQTVAVKVLSQALLDDAQAVGRFRREMQLIGSLDHPNIVRALNAGELEGMHYLAMEFVDGISLHTLVSNIRKSNESNKTLPLIPLGAACEAIRQAALGLQNAHELKLVHRDIKPANLMLDGRGTVKILDLGLGKFAEEQRSEHHSSLTMEGMVVGTVDYISPEQCENSREADIRSDLYSLACTFYFLLTGKPVYSGSRYNTMRKKLMGHIVGEVPSIRQEIPNLPLAVDALLHKALAKDPKERFQTPIEFADALAPFASFDELWALAGTIMPTDAAGPRSGSRYSSPYSLQSSRQTIAVKPASRSNRILFFVGLNILMGLGIFMAFYLTMPTQRGHITAMRLDAAATARNAEQLRSEWKMAQAYEEYQNALRKTRLLLARTEDLDDLDASLRLRLEEANTLWYLGDTRIAGRELDSIMDFINTRLDEDARLKFDDIRKIVFERRGDFGLFSGDASGLSSRAGPPERFENRIRRYNDAVRVDVNPDRNRVIRWKKAILWALHGNLEEAERLLEENPLLPNEEDIYFSLVHQLADAVVFYYQQDGNDNRDQRLRVFQRQFAIQSNAMSAIAMRPEVTELLTFSSEFLLTDSIRHENWRTLDGDFMGITTATNNFLRQRPGARPFMRRFYELLVRSAVLLHDNDTENPQVRQRHLDNIVRLLLERMRQSEAELAEGETPTVIYFFLPESNRAEDSFVIFYPQDGRDRVLYPLALTRQMVQEPDGRRIPSLPAELLAKIESERSLGRRIRVSWDDSASWSRVDDAMTDGDYPYGEVLPLR